jgi:hypothetical protein
VAIRPNLIEQLDEEARAYDMLGSALDEYQQRTDDELASDVADRP